MFKESIPCHTHIALMDDVMLKRNCDGRQAEHGRDQRKGKKALVRTNL